MDSLEKIEYVLLALSALSLILHAIASRTKTQADDIAAEVVDATAEAIKKRRPAPAKK